MLDFHVQIVSITRHLEISPDQNEQLLSEILLWPELLTFGNKLKSIQRHQQELAELLLKKQKVTEIHERQLTGEPSLGRLTIELHPPMRTKTWKEPLTLHYDFVEWVHDGSRIAYFPGLEIEVVTSDKEDSLQIREEHVRTAILRAGHTESLFNLALQQRTTKTEIQSSLLNLYPETPKERFEKSLSEDVKQSELKKVAINMASRSVPTAYHYENHVERLAQMLTGRRALSVLLVGPPGVGKTAIIQELVWRRNDHGLGGREFWKTSGARIVAGQSGFGDWQQRCQRIADEARERNAILYFGNLAELLETGRAGGSSENIAGFFRPRMMRGELIAILECTPEQLTAIEKKDPRVLDGLRLLKIEEPNPRTAYEILHSVALKKLIHLNQQTISETALQRIDALHRRYHGYSAYPGKPLRFLERLCYDPPADSGALTIERVNQAFSAETGLPLSLLEDSIQLDLGDIRAWFRKRLMGQDRAVNYVVDTIAMIKARLARPGKPLASFLFVGPTGVGKTELAKCLAEFFYASRDRMIRIDMSEYNTPESATRLVSNDQQANEGILTSQMRDQPFSVVLLDEFEKADPRVFDLFLQVLGEARLTDGAGRVADFSNAIIIMTSNLGAQNFRAGTKLGFAGEAEPDLGAEEHFTTEAKRIFRPEFFNRIDRIVPFLPLNRETLESIVSKELEGVRRRDGLRERHLHLDLLEAAVEDLLEHGHDPRFGARPLRREMDQRILRRIAGELNEDPGKQRGTLSVTDTGVLWQRDQEQREQRTSEVEELAKVSEIRRRFQGLARAAFVSELNSERYRLERRIKNHQATGAGEQDEVSLTYARKKIVDDLLDRLDTEFRRVVSYEEALLLRSTGHDWPWSDQRAVDFTDFKSILIELYAAAERQPEQFLLTFQTDRRSRLFTVAKTYCEAAKTLKCAFRLGIFPKKPADDEFFDAEKQEMLPEPVTDVKAFFENPPKDIHAIALEITAPHGYLLFAGEAGAHEFEYEDNSGKQKDRLLITLLEQTLETAWVQTATLDNPPLRSTSVHRFYSQIRGTWKDTKQGTSDRGEFGSEWLAQFLYDRLVAQAERAI